ncbi:MAG: hypothetical protein M4579_005225 [Chaenotheca gracillima]|nr:MAG: hypothetical protein M4579_005225 [Chaenotheca gracillima]
MRGRLYFATSQLIWAPGVSFFSFFQAHPFMITWWESVDDEAQNVSLLIKARDGFTDKLLRRSTPGDWILTVVDGPYGSASNAADYGSVVMFATGIGIAAQIPYIKALIRDYREHKARTKRISLFWQLDHTGEFDWVADWMDQLLEEDKDYILHITLFRPPSKSADRLCKHGQHNRVSEIPGTMNPDEILYNECSLRAGRLLVTVSTNSSLRDQVRRLIQKGMDEGIKLLELEFQPMEKSVVWTTKAPV